MKNQGTKDNGNSCLTVVSIKADKYFFKVHIYIFS
nr:MAG TPA: hypothetical protein [Caudoviricetes sp.]